MTNSLTSRILGALFLGAFVSYGVGSALVDRPVGVALMLLNSMAVGTIGAVVFGMLRCRHSQVATTYLLARTLEATLLAVGVLHAGPGWSQASACY